MRHPPRRRGAARRRGEARATARRGPRTRELAPSVDNAAGAAWRGRARRAAQHGATRGTARRGQSAAGRGQTRGVASLSDVAPPKGCAAEPLGNRCSRRQAASATKRAGKFPIIRRQRTAPPDLRFSLMKIRKSSQGALSNLYTRKHSRILLLRPRPAQDPGHHCPERAQRSTNQDRHKQDGM